MNESLLSTALSNPKSALAALDKYESEHSLLNFMKLGWHALEPGIEFVPNWGVHAICDHLEAVTRGDIRRLLINVPPGCTKSMTTNVFWPAWEWGPKVLPHYRYISFAHEQSLATRDNVRCRTLINSEWYQELWGDKFDWKSDQNAKIYFENTRTGWRQSCPADSMTGKRGDRIIGDDPHTVKAAESEVQREDVLQTFSETIPTRLNRPMESAIVVIMQRVHERDVSGLILSKELGYEHLMLPMEFENDRRCYSSVKPSYIKNPKRETVYYKMDEHAWRAGEPVDKDEFKIDERYNVDPRLEEGELLDPVRFPKQSIDELKAALRAFGGTYAEAGQLQQRPAPRGGGLFKKVDFKIIDSLSELIGNPSHRVRGWDLACSTKKTSPYTVGVKMLKIGKHIVVTDVDRSKKSPGLMEANVKKVTEQDGHRVTQDIPQDPGQAGKTQKAAFAGLLHGYPLSFSPESGDKEARAIPFAAQVEAGNVYLLRADWNDPYINELALFPNGTFKDQADASSRAYGGVIKRRPKKIGAAPQLVTPPK